MSASPSHKKSDGPLFNWLTQRSAGVLLHPTSLPGDQGIGTLEQGPLDDFLSFLAEAGIKNWQVCPLGPTGYGDSPYQCFSAFAGNPYLIDLKALVGFGLLEDQDLAELRALPRERVDFGALWQKKWTLLFKAHAAFLKNPATALPYGSFDAFKHNQSTWLQPYGFFRALKDHFDGAAWWTWPTEQRNFKTAQKSSLRSTLNTRSDAHAFFQYLFYGQWEQARQSARVKGIEIIGDIPIFVAMDSADAWSAPHLFEIDEATGKPLAVAGVPPDYFSSDGQLWGNPLYKWEAHVSEKFAWWRARLAASFAQADIIRIDHFRAFNDYWRIPADAKTAKTGKWCDGPGLAFFRAVKESFPEARIIAEDLGDIGQSVRDLRDHAGLPGMAILQFAFGGDAKNFYLPHNHTANSVVYPGTHDNDTTLGWYASSSEQTRAHVDSYLRVTGKEIGWDFLRASYSSVCRLCIIPFQDILALGSEARMNTPGVAQGNWQWRFVSARLSSLKGPTTAYLRELGTLYDRLA